jgi:hypothetical protein
MAGVGTVTFTIALGEGLGNCTFDIEEFHYVR